MSHLRTPAHPVGLIKSAIKNPTNCQMLNRQFQPAKSMDRWRVEAGAGAGELGPPLDPIPLATHECPRDETAWLRLKSPIQYGQMWHAAAFEAR